MAHLGNIILARKLTREPTSGKTELFLRCPPRGKMENNSSFIFQEQND